MKKRILFVGESSFLATGYAVYAHEVLSRLHATGKYEIAELGCYGEYNDERQKQVKWKFYHNVPSESEKKEYFHNTINEFGAFRFEDTCLDFKPNICFSIRDWWMDEFIERSPFRKLFHWAIMPPVDCYPQDAQWISTFMNADSVFSYTDWGGEILKQQTNNKIKYVCSASPGADKEIFKKLSRENVRVKYGVPKDAFVIGTCMRNQKRKLFPDLIKSFGKILRQTKRNDVYLYLHTCYPDVGWDIPRLLNEENVSHRTLFTYKCNSCNDTFSALYSDAKTVCSRCGKATVTMPSTNNGVSREELAEIYNTFNVYVQYANSEGFGMPMVEAAYCELPVMAINYSAMSDVVKKVYGWPIPTIALAREAETHGYRAIPNNEWFIEKILHALNCETTSLDKIGKNGRESALYYFNYDKTALILGDHFDTIDVNYNSWYSKPRIVVPSEEIPANVSNEEFVRWCISFVMGRPDLADSYMANRLTRSLNWGHNKPGMGGLVFNDASNLGIGESPERQANSFNRDSVVKELLKIVDKNNYWEQKRASMIGGSK